LTSETPVVLDYERTVAVAGYRVGELMTEHSPAPLDELQDTLAAVDRALNLLERLQSAPHATNIHLEKPREKMRWAIKRLSKRAWVLTTQIQAVE
jgi:hypothetical protein